MKKDDTTYTIRRTITQAPEPTAGLGSGLSSLPPECTSLKIYNDHKDRDLDYWKSLDSWRIIDGAILLFTNFEPCILGSNNPLVKDLQECRNINEAIDYLKGIILRRAEKGIYTSEESIEKLESLARMFQLIQSSLDAGTIDYLDGSYSSRTEQLVKPSVFIKWAIQKGFQIPDELRALAEDSQFHSEETPSYLDLEHPAYAPELAVAVKAWVEIHSSGILKDNKGHKDQIKKFLKERFPEADLSKEALDRIATVINSKARKGGGCLPIEVEE